MELEVTEKLEVSAPIINPSNWPETIIKERI
jgi:hypothetical protein